VRKNVNILLVCLYVDDLIFTGNNPSMFEYFKKAMTQEFEMTDIGLMSYYLAIEVKQMEKGDEEKVLKLKKTFLALNKHQVHRIVELRTTFKRIVSLNVLINMPLC
jgi:hypothetical protein